MKACVLESVGNLVYKEVEKPEPKKGEVLLKIKACGICSSDIDRVFKTGTYHFPTIPGHEFSGIIEKAGEGVDQALLGKKAAVFPLLPCRKCVSCQIGQYARCDNYNYFGSRCDGGFAEYLAVPTWNLVLMDDDMSYEVAALCEPAAVAMHAVDRSGLRLGNVAVIVGTGTIAFLTAILAIRAGAKRIIMVGRNAGKKQIADSCDKRIVYLDSSVQDVEGEVTRVTDGKLADVVFDCVGSAEAVSEALKLAGKGGNVLLMGNPTGDMELPRGAYWKILRSELQIKGTWNSSYNEQKNDWRDVLAVLKEEQERLKSLITHQVSLGQYKEAFSYLTDKSVMTLKVMFMM